jgi:hypothetical protein
MRIAPLLNGVEGFWRAPPRFEDENIVAEGHKLVREREASDASADDADAGAEEVASSCAAIELSEIDLHAPQAMLVPNCNVASA